MTRNWVVRGATALLLVLVALGFAACGGSGGKGGGNSKEVAELLGYQSAEGTLAAPVNIGDVTTTGVVTREGTAASGGGGGVGDTADSYYLVTGIVPGVVYTVTLGNLSDDADVYVYQGDPTFKASPATRIGTSTNTETFTITAEPNVSSFFVGVDASKTAKGAAYTLSVLVQPVTEGRYDNPVDLYHIPTHRVGSTVAYDPLCNTTVCGPTTGDSFYKVRLPSAMAYLISVTGMTDDVDLYVYKFATGGPPAVLTPDGAGGFTETLACSSTQEGLPNEICTYSAAADDTVVIDVDGHFAAAGAGFTVNVIEAPLGPKYTETGTYACRGFPCQVNNATGIADELFIQDSSRLPTVKREPADQVPVAGISGCLTSALPAGSAGPREACVDSYYKAVTIPGTRYRMALENATDRAHLWVFGRDGAFTVPVCQPPYDREDVEACTFTAGNNATYFAVDGSETAAGAAYRLSMMPAFVANGSKEAPLELVDVSVDPLPFNGKGTALRDDTLGIGTGQDSYYVVTGLAAGHYIVSLPAMSDDANLYVYGDDSTFTTPSCVPFEGQDTAENCVVSITGGSLYFATDGYFSRDGAAYLILVDNLSSEGTPTAPIAIGGSPTNYFGHAVTATGNATANEDGVDSFYRAAVTAGKGYRVGVHVPRDENNLPTNTVNLRVFDASNFTSELCSATEDLDNHETGCTAVPNGSDLYIVVDGGPGTSPFVTYELQVHEDGGVSAQAITLTGATTTYPASGTIPIQPGGSPGVAGDVTDRYFKFTPLSASTKYRITLHSVAFAPHAAQDLDLYVFRGGTSFYNAFLCESKVQGSGDEVCDHNIFDSTFITANPASERVYIGVDSFPASAPGSFTLLIEEIP